MTTDITFRALGPTPAAPIPGSSGDMRERLWMSCFPPKDEFYFYYRLSAEDPKSPLLGSMQRVQNKICCCIPCVPQFIKVELALNGRTTHVVDLNVNSLAKRCHLPKDTVYQAYLTDTLWGLLEQQGLFLRLKHHLDGIVPQGAELISQRVAASYKERHRSCQYTGCSDFTQNKHLQLNLRVEWFPNGEFAIFWGSCNPPIYFTANADQKILCAFKQIPDQTIFPVYQFLAKQPKETPGIWRVLNLSSPNEHGFRVYHKPYTAHLNDTKTLEQVVRWPIDTKVKIAKALLTSLAAMHKNKIVHYQLDLRAIHINAPKKGLEEAVIGNMEFARLMTDSTEIQNLPQHSEAPEFVAPELRLLHATQLQPSANVFSLGTIFKKLFGATYAAQSTEIFCEGMISRIIDRMTAENPQERCTAAEALNKFQNALETSPSR